MRLHTYVFSIHLNILVFREWYFPAFRVAVNLLRLAFCVRATRLSSVHTRTHTCTDYRDVSVCVRLRLTEMLLIFFSGFSFVSPYISVQYSSYYWRHAFL